MIQRVQSIYLFGGFAAIMSMFFVPFARIIVNNSSGFLFLHEFQVEGLPIEAYNPILVLLIGVLTALGFLVSIFLFKNRVFQMRFNIITFLLNGALIALMFWVGDNLATALGGISNYKYIGAGMPLISIILLIAANRAIRSDEAKVRAADRIR
jgi:hypothetical protein